MLQVANVMREKGLHSLTEAERVLEVPTDAEHRAGKRMRHANRSRRESAGAAHERSPTPDHTHHTIITAGFDWTVVSEPDVRDVAQTSSRLVIGIGDRLVAAVAARQHQGTT